MLKGALSISCGKRKHFSIPLGRSRTLHNSPKVETAQMLITQWMDKQNVVWAHNGTWLNHEKKCGWCLLFFFFPGAPKKHHVTSREASHRDFPLEFCSHETCRIRQIYTESRQVWWSFWNVQKSKSGCAPRINSVVGPLYFKNTHTQIAKEIRSVVTKGGGAEGEMEKSSQKVQTSRSKMNKH